MRKIGGFFELELPPYSHSSAKGALALTSGRACLNFILRQIKPKRVYLPFFSCPALITPLHHNKIEFSYYSINANLDPCLKGPLRDREYIIYINYFGIKSATVAHLISMFGDRIIVDNAQAFFDDTTGTWAFNSARKFFGVPDGAFLYSPRKLTQSFQPNTDIQTNYLVNRLIGRQEVAYRQFLRSERMVTLELRGISELSARILKAINYKEIAQKRRRNFLFLHQVLGKHNTFTLPMQEKGAPLCYPFLPQRQINKKILHKSGIFIPTYWKIPQTIKLPDFEKILIRRLLPLPIDQRYGEIEMDFIAGKILRFIG